MKYQYGVIGCGNMGGAVALALAKTAGGARMLVADAFAEKAEQIAKEAGASVGTVAEIAAECETVVLGVKPQGLAALFDEMRHVLDARTEAVSFVSMAAGVSIASICEMAGKTVPVIRIMPNTPLSVGEGMVLYTANDAVTETVLDGFVSDMRACGMLDRIDEKLIDAGSAVSGCGPAFAYLFLEALADGGVSCGLPRDKALLYAAQTVLGASRLVLESGRHPGELKDAVCSPAGSTIEGVHALENGAFRASAIDAVRAAYLRTKELGKN